jgi:hypothetical protein
MHLHEMQSLFLSGVLQGSADIKGVLPAENTDARLRVYRHNFMQGHVSALAKVYRATAVYLGDLFEVPAIEYVCHNRPQIGSVLGQYGDGFWQCLTHSALKDLARLEWAMHAASIAQRDKGERLMCEDSETVRWTLRKDVRLVHVQHAVLPAYESLMQGVTPLYMQVVDTGYAVFRNDLGNGVACMPICADGVAILKLLQESALTIDEIFDKLTISQERFTILIQRLFVKDLVKVTHAQHFEISKNCSVL